MPSASFIIRFIIPFALFGLLELPANAADVDDWITTVLEVQDRGKGHAQATAAIESLQKADRSALLPILTAMKSSNPLARNWLVAAFEAIADRIVRSDQELPIKDLVGFIKDRDQSPRARRLAFEWIRQVEPEIEDALIPGMLLDPSPEFRRDAVQRLIDTAQIQKDDGNESAARTTLQKALRGAVDDDQVKAIVKPLKAMGVEVNLQDHFGFVVSWSIVGPFDNRGMKGFDVAYPPEESVNLTGRYEGQLGEVSWEPLATTDDYGIVDIGKSVQNYKGSAMYLTSEFQSDGARQVEIRLGTPNAWKLWVNGELQFAREEYHRGSRLDQYRVPVQLKKGANRFLLKILQNEQTQDWAQDYKFQLRVCDPAGSAILAETRK